MQTLKEMLKKLIEEESKSKSIEVSGQNLEGALKKAAGLLNIGLNQLDYEILEYGNNGIFGINKKNFKIKVYKANKEEEIIDSVMNIDIVSEESSTFEIKQEIVNKDSDVFVRLTSKGIMLKITSPSGKGKKISEKKVLDAISARGISNFDLNKVNRIIREANGEYCKIGEMPVVNIANDSTASVQISSDEMKAYIMLTPPRAGGFDLDLDEIRSILNNNGVVVGINDEALIELIDHPVYNESILVASGVKVNEGKNATVNYNFNINKDEVHFEEEDGKVNFKELNNIQNVVAGQILATKEAATEGEPGRTVTNKLMPAKSGKDTVLLAGRNTKVTDDGLSIVSEINGQVYLMGGRVVVDPVYTIQGDVNLKTGNVLFLGTVIIQGNVEDGFSIKAAGNIEIHGSVGKCELDAEGDIIINGGVMGKNEGLIKSGKSLYAKFIESVKVEVNEGVYAQDGILHSYIDAIKEILCVGKRGAIVGGRLRAGELVKTKTIGSIANPETIIEVGIDPKKRQVMEEQIDKREKAYKELEPLKANYENLKNQKQVMKKLPPEKEELLIQLRDKVAQLNGVIKTANEEIKGIEEYLSQLKSKGKVIASKKAFPGVKIYIKNSFLQLKSEYKRVAFILQAGEVDTIPYDEEEVQQRRR